MFESLDRCDHVVAQVQVGQHSLILQAFDPLDAVLVNVQAAQVRVLLEPEQAVAPVALKVEHLELGEELHAFDFIET